MLKRPFSLRTRLFIAMLSLVMIASVVIAGITTFRYKNEAEQYHKERLERKEMAIKQNINYVLKRTTYPVTTKNIPLIFKENGRIYELSAVHRMPLIIYDLKGELLIKSNESFIKDSVKQGIPNIVISKMNASPKKRFLVSYEREGERFQSSYSYITDNKFKPLAILNLPYLQNDDLVKKDILAFLRSLVEVYLFMLLICIGLAYLLSNYITRSITAISEKINKTRIGKQNKKIEASYISEEVSVLVEAYNSMIDQLEESAVKLAVSERENAWREMAKQVAHEIKNPLTPMRLTVQNFHRKFDPSDPQIKNKLTEYSDTLIQQIDTMSAIASAFSNFAKMPERKDEILNVNEVVASALDIFTEDGIVFNAAAEEILINFDRTQLIRVITNLVKNALQAVPEDRSSAIEVTISRHANDAYIYVKDNGVGIDLENKQQVFEPNFTTKSSGMGLGLAMVKSIIETYKGTISYTSVKNKGTEFVVRIPLQ
ncbi:sensor histidine kinase [Aquimarina agarilytica]|uniref:sensor histidine kinase n=1 Tax=Aquimarina agarilytica TaxID=1087449 RepID=UPI000288397A|nr:ATP-binding protein [Aquimarina agarilytica]